MKQLILVGAGAFGLEVWSWLKSSKGYNEDFIFKGFIDSKIDNFRCEHFCNGKILGNIEDYQIESNDVFVCTIGDPIIKERIILNLTKKGAKFINLIHQSAILFNNVQLATGIIVSPNCIISNSAQIHAHVSINLFCSIGHDTEIGEFSVLSSHCDITGYVRMGKGVFLGSSVSIVPNTSIADYVKVGAGAVVFRPIRKMGTYIGNPAKRLGQ